MQPKHIQYYLKTISLPMPSSEVFAKIEGIEGGDFNNRLIAAANGDKVAESYVTSVIKATAPFCADTLKLNGFEHGLERIVRVAVKEGSPLFRAIKALHYGGDVAGVARTYLEGHFELTPRPDQRRDPDSLPDFSGSSRKRDVPQPATQHASRSLAPISTHPVPRISSTQTHDPVAGASDCAVKNAKSGNNNLGGKEDPAERKYNFSHVYGNKSALCFNEVMSTDGSIHTVRIEGASAAGVRQYDWAKKIAVQLTLKEMYMVLAVLLMKLESVELSGHGVGHDKSFKLERQNGHYFVQISQVHRGVIGVPISGGDAIPVTTMFLKQIHLNAPHLNNEMIMLMLENSVSMVKDASDVKKQRTA